jgi:HTH-type transcriptional regulator, sugar sensing transcriptional regulator
MALLDTEALEEIGLTRNETRIYITLLEIGKAHIGEISEKTRMHRRTIYDCLERLIDRGLVSFILEGKTRYFAAVNPQKIKEILKEKESRIENILPNLFELVNKSKHKTEATIYKGKEGLKNIMEDLVKSKPKIWYSLTSSSKAKETFPVYLYQFHEKRIKERVLLKIIFGKHERAIKRSEELKKNPLTEVRFTDLEYVIPISIWIYNNKLAFMLWDSEIGILIESKETTDTFKNYFKMLWKIAKK